MDSVVVYRANSESLQAVIGFLRKEGFNPTSLEDPSAGASLSGAGKAAYLVSVLVPRDEAPGAKSVLLKWDQARQSEVKRMTGVLAGAFLCSVAVVLVLAVISLFFGILSEAAPLLFVVGLGVFVVLASVARITQTTKGNKDDKIRRRRRK
jgi:hypothetical protein